MFIFIEYHCECFCVNKSGLRAKYEFIYIFEPITTTKIFKLNYREKNGVANKIGAILIHCICIYSINLHDDTIRK